MSTELASSVTKRSRMSHLASNSKQRALIVDVAGRLCEMSALELAEKLIKLSSLEWQALAIVVAEEAHEIFRCQPPQTQARLMELRIQKGLTRNALVTRLMAADRSLKITELNLVHIETSGKERLETPAAWRDALSKFFGASWDELAAPIRTK